MASVAPTPDDLRVLPGRRATRLTGVRRVGAKTGCPTRRVGSPPPARSCSAALSVEPRRVLCGHLDRVIGLYIAYVIPTFLRLRAGEAFKPGRGPGPLGRPIAVVAVGWVVIITILFMLPQTSR